MRHRKLTIEEWQQPATTEGAFSHSARWSQNARVFGVVGTLLLHMVVCQPLIVGTLARKFQPPAAQGRGAAFMRSTISPSAALILLALPSTAMSDNPLLEDLASRRPLSKSITLALLSPNPLPHVAIPAEDISDDSRPDATIDSGDQSKRTVLFGRYTGQIDARIERAWRRPRSPINPNFVALQSSSPSAAGAVSDATFKCQVRIIQDDHGTVQEVQMLRCNGSVAWRQSLVFAILSVSPLPAPPDPAVFSPTITMTFTANPYTPGSAADDYELESTAVARRTVRQAAWAPSEYLRKAPPAETLFSHPAP